MLRGRSTPFARHEAAAAMSDVRAFVRAWRPAASEKRMAGGQDLSEEMEGGGVQIAPKKPSPDALLKLAQVRRHVSFDIAYAHAGNTGA